MKITTYGLFLLILAGTMTSCVPVVTGSNDYIISNNTNTPLKAVVYYADATNGQPKEFVSKVDKLADKIKEKVDNKVTALKDDISKTTESIKQDLKNVKNQINEVVGDTVFSSENTPTQPKHSSDTEKNTPTEDTTSFIADPTYIEVKQTDTFSIEPTYEVVVITEPTVAKYIINEKPDLTKKLSRVELHYQGSASPEVWEGKYLYDRLYIKENGNGYMYILYANHWKAWFYRNTAFVVLFGIVVLGISYLLYRFFHQSKPKQQNNNNSTKINY